MCSSFSLFEKYGVDQCTLEVLEECKLEERYIKEREWIERTANAVNKIIPHVTKQEKNTKRLILHECVCGGKYSVAHKARHYASTFHVRHSQA
jgi:hypothetical protein